MISKILLKLIDQSIIPAVLVVITRLVSLVLISDYYNIEYTLQKNGFILDFSKDYLLLNSYSILSIIAICTLGITFTIISSNVFHHEYIKPSVTATLFSIRMSYLIKNSFEIYTKAAVWISYLWLLTFTTGVMLFHGSIFSFVFYISTTVTVVMSVILIIDVEKKTNVSKYSNFIFDTDRKFLEELDQ